MKQLLLGTLVALSWCSVPALADPPRKPAPQAAEEKLTVPAGSSKSLEIANITRLALGDPEIADVTTVGGNVIRIDGKKAGETVLLVWAGAKRKAYRIVVE